MIKGVENVTLYSGDAKNLAEFYRDKVGFKITVEADMGDGKDKLFGVLIASLFNIKNKNNSFFISEML